MVGIGISLVTGGAPFAGPVKVTDGLFAEFDGRDTSTMTRSVNRVDEWRSKIGSHKFVTTSAGTGLNPSYSSSLFNNQGGINFASKYLETFDALTDITTTTGVTILMVMKKTSRSSYFFLCRGGGGFIASGTSERIGSAAQAQGREGIIRNQSIVYGYRWNTTAANRRMIINGELFGPSEGNFQNFTGAFGKMTVGGIVGSGIFGIMELGAIYMYNRPLTDDEVVQMSAYLKSNWALSDIPAPTWNVAIEGNSLAAGASGTSVSGMYDGFLDATGSPTQIDCKVFAVSASTMTSMNSREATLDAYYNSAILDKRRICIIWEITNSLALSATKTDVQAYDEFKLYCQNRKAAGWKVIVLTALPRTATGNLNANFETYRVQVNAWIVANAVSEGWADAVADVAAHANLSDHTNTTYFSTDGIHLKDAGHTVVRGLVTAAINTVTA